MQPEIVKSKTNNHLSAAGESIEKGAEDILDKGRKAFASVVDQGETLAKNALSEVESAVEATGGQIKKYPVQALLIGLGVGALLGFVFNGFRSNQRA